jgi:hypothetical protein
VNLVSPCWNLTGCVEVRAFTDHFFTVMRQITSTCHSSGSRQLRDQEFDIVIIDEATQALEAVSSLVLISPTSHCHPGVLDPDFQSKKAHLGR